MAIRFKKAVQFYLYTLLIGVSAFFLSFFGVRSDKTDHFTDYSPNLGRIPTASADIPGYDGSDGSDSFGADDCDGDGDCDGE